MINNFGQRVPRQLTKLEVVDIHLIVKATHPRFGILAQFKEKKSDDKQN